MQDRIVEFPQRYLLVPVSGEDGQYDLYPVTGTVTTAGTPLIKANLLTDATAALLGLSGDPTIDDALAKLSEKLRYQTGTYTGDGTYGVANPVSVTFDFEPVFFYVVGNINVTSMFPWIVGTGAFAVRYNNAFVANTITQNGNTVSWYQTGLSQAAPQMNESGVTYTYIGIG